MLDTCRRRGRQPEGRLQALKQGASAVSKFTASVDIQTNPTYAIENAHLEIIQ
jgi:hypothetical protein